MYHVAVSSKEVLQHQAASQKLYPHVGMVPSEKHA
jgi:hypothetical protein